jgi:hypothetical protein
MTNQVNDKLCTRIHKSNVNLAIYTGCWLITTALLAFGPKFIWDFSVVFTLFAIAFNIGSGALMIFANIKHLNSLDELGRKIFLDSAAITLGVVMVFGVCYELTSYAGESFAFKATISHIYFVMGITFMLSVFLGHRKYR